MAKFNKTTKGANKTVNRSGHAAYKMSDKLTLTTMVLTTMFGEGKYYGDNSDELIQLAMKTDMSFIAKLAVYARKVFHLRSVSHALTAVLANCARGGTVGQQRSFVRRAISDVVERPDDITEIMACYIAMFGKPVPSVLKRGLSDAFLKFNEYSLAKYSGGSKEFKLKDVHRMVHAKPDTKEREELYKKLNNDDLATPVTWETELSVKGNTKEVWENLIAEDKIGYMAAIRNLRNIIKAKPNNFDKILDKLKNREEVLKSKLLPFRFYSAYGVLTKEGLATSKIIDALEIALRHSVENIEKIPGKTLIAIDVSGSMNSGVSNKSDVRCSDIAALMAAMANCICEDSKIVSFDTNLRTNIPMSSVGGIIQNAKSITVNGGGTDITLPFQWATNNEQHFDRIILLSDNEINRGVSTCQVYMNQYRREVNPDAWIHAIDLQGYGTRQFIGSKTNIIAGWSEKVLDFIMQAEKGFDTIVKEIENYNPYKSVASTDE